MALLGCAVPSSAQEVVLLDGITFADESNAIYVPVKEVGFAYGWEMTSEKTKFYVNGRAVSIPRVLPDGTRLIPLTSLPHLGLRVEGVGDEVAITDGNKELRVRVGEKRVVINKKEQKLRGYQGDRLIVETRVSTGRRGYTTPDGTWAAGPEKSRMRYSRKYDNSPMPWSIQITGGYFMHGYTSVPRRPASHGCVRLPLWGINFAKWIWHWVDLGTPITIGNDWGPESRVAAKPKASNSPETIAVTTPRQ